MRRFTKDNYIENNMDSQNASGEKKEGMRGTVDSEESEITIFEHKQLIDKELLLQRTNFDHWMKEDFLFAEA